MPHVPKGAADAVAEVLSTRWIGQGPKVDEFERSFASYVGSANTLAVGSGTDALHLAYRLAGLREGDEVIAPVFTCTATNIPLLYEGVTPVFADVDPGSLNMSVSDVRGRINDRTRAIICVDYGGKPCDLLGLKELADEFGIPLIEDAAHSLGAEVGGQRIGSIADFTMFSFQAIKHVTTGDGGMLTFQDSAMLDLAKRLRWFGIDRLAKFGGVWENDIVEVGYKYQMTDISAAMGLVGLAEFGETLSLRQSLMSTYVDRLQLSADVRLLGAPESAVEVHAAWLCTVAVDRRVDLERWLQDNNVESGQVHYRNDRYSIFGGRRDDLPNMDDLEDKYLVLPMHTHMTIDDVHMVCDLLVEGW